jgi:hypothetical protein
LHSGCGGDYRTLLCTDDENHAIAIIDIDHRAVIGQTDS